MPKYSIFVNDDDGVYSVGPFDTEEQANQHLKNKRPEMPGRNHKVLEDIATCDAPFTGAWVGHEQ